MTILESNNPKFKNGDTIDQISILSAMYFEKKMEQCINYIVYNFIN